MRGNVVIPRFRFPTGVEFAVCLAEEIIVDGPAKHTDDDSHAAQMDAEGEDCVEQDDECT